MGQGYFFQIVLFVTISIVYVQSKDCKCVPYHKCKKINEDGANKISLRIDADSDCESYLDVCCKRQDIIGIDDNGIPPRQSNGTNGGPGNSGDDNEEDDVDYDDENNVGPGNYGSPGNDKGTGNDGGPGNGGGAGSEGRRHNITCGIRNFNGIGFRITNNKDNEAEFGEFPWMVAILRPMLLITRNIQIYKCGGALIHPKVVVTAAHCVFGMNGGLVARAGEWDTQTKKEHIPYQDRTVKKIIIHKDYHSGNVRNDIALLVLSRPFRMRDNVGLICLPPLGLNFDRSKCVSSGWGKDVFGVKGRNQVILKKVELPIVPRAECQDRLRAKLGRAFNLHESWICAGGEKNVDTCTGDGGSPLACPIRGSNGRYYQAGIVAWGVECGRAIPGGYVNVAHFRKWIDDQMKCHKFKTSFYQY